jgi:DNA-binding NtrC family response regulator
MSTTHTFDTPLSLVGASPAMRDIEDEIVCASRSNAKILITGESGVGKEVVARLIHQRSDRAHSPLVTINCAGVPDTLLESELFGHMRGAFTDAYRDKRGWLDQAHGGTIFMDEVGEMSLRMQALLLRFLESGEIQRVGSDRVNSRVDVRVIAATNRDLADFVREGRFREDLYYRLSVFELYIPPLRDRGSDIELLVNYFLDHFRRQHGRPGLAFSPEAKQKLLAYSWPGNVRQLRNVIDSAVVMCEGNVILSDDLGLRDAGNASDQLESLRIDFWERKLIHEALKRAGGSIPDAAKLLGLGRATLYRKVEEYGIERK